MAEFSEHRDEGLRLWESVKIVRIAGLVGGIMALQGFIILTSPTTPFIKIIKIGA